MANTPTCNHKLSINVCLHCISSHVGDCSCVGEVAGCSVNLACAISAGERRPTPEYLAPEVTRTLRSHKAQFTGETHTSSLVVNYTLRVILY